MKIVYKSVTQITPYENNPRVNDKAVEAVAASIKEFGFKQPIVVDSQGVIVAGHTRYKAALSLGMDKVPVLVADDLTEEQVREYRLADNKTAEQAQWDWSKLEEELANIDTDMSIYGFEKYETVEVEQDECPEAKEESDVKIKEGDIFKLGNHVLMCGDSTSEDDIRMLMGGQKAELLFTSPPYSDMRSYEGGDLEVSHIAEFIKAYKEYVPYQVVNLGIKRSGGEIDTYWDEYIKQAKQCGYKLLAWNVWDKCGKMSVGSASAMIPIRHEWIFAFCDTAEFEFLFGEEPKEINKTRSKKATSISNKRRMKTVRQQDGSMKYSSFGSTTSQMKKMESITSLLPVNASSDHPAMFPVELPAEYIKAMTGEGDTVIEPFGGSGTTLIACEQLGRKCRIMELSPKYCDLIIRRWENETGEKAIRIN